MYFRTMKTYRIDSRSSFGAEARSRRSECWKTLSAAMAICFAVSAGSSLRADPKTYTYYDLTTVNKVQNGKKDRAFLEKFLPTVKDLVKSDNLGQTTPNGWKKVDATKLTLAESYGVRAYFVGEDTAYHNSLGFNTNTYGKGAIDPIRF